MVKNEFIVLTVMSFLGFGLAISVMGVNIYNLIQNKNKVIPILYLAVSGFYIYTLLTNLIKQNTGLVCSVTPIKIVVIYFVLVVLHGYFLYDSIKAMRKK